MKWPQKPTVESSSLSPWNFVELITTTIERDIHFWQVQHLFGKQLQLNQNWMNILFQDSLHQEAKLGQVPDWREAIADPGPDCWRDPEPCNCLPARPA